MHTRTLGRTELKISEIGLGCASFWGHTLFDETEAVRLVHEAAAQGVTFFDTGASYSGGNAEPRLGRALAAMSSKNDLIISTKAGTRIGRMGRLYKDFSPAWITQSVENSLGRLGLESLPLLHLHGPKICHLTDALLKTLEQLRAAGKVRHFSVNSFDEPVIEHLLTLPIFEAVMIDYNILRPEREPLLEKLAANGMGILAGMAMAGRYYSPSLFKVRLVRDAWYLLRALKNHRTDIMRGRAFHFIENEPSFTGGQIALGFVLANPLVSCAVFGTTRLANLKEALAVCDTPLPADLLARLRAAQKS